MQTHFTCIVLYLYMYIYISLLAVHINQKRFQSALGCTDSVVLQSKYVRRAFSRLKHLSQNDKVTGTTAVLELESYSNCVTIFLCWGSRRCSHLLQQELPRRCRN